MFPTSSEESIPSSYKKTPEIARHQDLMLQKEDEKILVEVSVRTKIPSIYRKSSGEEGVITLVDIDDYITNLNKDNDWWGFIQSSVRLNAEDDAVVVKGMQWEQKLWFIGPIHHLIEVVDRKLAYSKNIAVPFDDSFPLSYIAEYIIEEFEEANGEKYFIFTLKGKLDIPQLKKIEIAVGAFTRLVSQYNLYKLTKVFGTGKFKEG